jgi:hypothetical protein
MNGSRAKFYLERLLEKKEIQLAMRERIVQYFAYLRRAMPSGEVGGVPDLADFIQIQPEIETITIQVYFEHNWKPEHKKLMFDGIEKFVRPYIGGAIMIPAKGVVVFGDPDPHQTHKTTVNSIIINVKEIPKAVAVRSQSSRIKCSECEGSGERQCAQCLGSGRHGTFPDPTDCVYCYGKGHIECSNCGGSGWRS